VQLLINLAVLLVSNGLIKDDLTKSLVMIVSVFIFAFLGSLRPNNSCRCVKFSGGEFRLHEELLAGLLELAHGRGDRSIWRRGAAVEQLG